MKKLLVCIVLFFCVIATAKATHITHGSWSYEYLGEDNNGNRRYNISLVLYRDCMASPVAFDKEVSIGVYHEQSPWQREEKYNLQLKSEKNETHLEVGNIGSLSNSTCYKKGIYQQVITLPKSQQGYYLVWNRCCKTGSNNLIDDMSSNYTVLIPNEPNNLAAPFFGGAIIANKNVVTQLGISYYDVDGDSLSYEFTELLRGPLSDQNPTWGVSPNISFPIEKVIYRNGYSAQLPLGQNSTSKVSSKGILKLFSNNIGRFFIGIKVTEWRNGKKLTEQIREIPAIFVSSLQNTTEVFLNTEGGVAKKEIYLNWAMTLVSLEADSFEIERRVKGTQSWNKVAMLMPENFTYLDTSINYDIMYEYRITGHLDNGGFKISNTDEAMAVSWDPISSTKEIVNKNFTIYPNPANNKLFISATSQYDIKKIVVTNLQGKTVISSQFINEASTKGLDISQLPQGVYLVKVLDKQGGIEIQKIVKQ